MHQKLKVGFIAAITCFAVFYGLAAFVWWDPVWAKDLGSWRPSDRFGILYVMGLLPMMCGIIAGMFVRD